MLADLRYDTFKQVRASYVIAADGGSSPTRGQLGIGYSGKTYRERWVVIDTEVSSSGMATTACGFTATPRVRPSTARRRWATTAGSPRPAPMKIAMLVSDEAVWKVLDDQGVTRRSRPVLRR